MPCIPKPSLRSIRFRIFATLISGIVTRRKSTLTRLTSEGRHYHNLYIGFNKKTRAFRYHGCRVVVVKTAWAREVVVAATQRAEQYGCRKGTVVRTFVVDCPAKQLSYGKVYNGDYDKPRPRQPHYKRRYVILNGPAPHLSRITYLSAEKRHYQFMRMHGQPVEFVRHPQLGRIFETKYYAKGRPFRLYMPGRRLARFPHQSRLVKVSVGSRYIMIDYYFQQFEEYVW